MNKIVVDNCVYLEHVAHLAVSYIPWEQEQIFMLQIQHLMVKQAGPGGMFYGGAVWGGGSWMGTMDTLVFENNTVHGIVGEAIVAYPSMLIQVVD